MQHFPVAKMARGRSGCSVAMAVVMVLTMAMAVNASTVHMVGGSNKWNTPSVNNLPTDYLQTWANNQSFVTGDVLSMLYLSISLDHQLHRPCCLANFLQMKFAVKQMTTKHPPES